jgi:hypothetical protein
MLREVKMVAAHDDVCFDKARDGFEDALGAVGLFLAPEGEAFGEVLVTKVSLNIEDRESRRARTTTCAQHFE